MENRVDFYVKTWETVNVSDKILEEVKSKITSGAITCSNDICDNYDPEEWDYDTSNMGTYAEQISVTENGGAATIELSIDGNDIWDNSIEKLK
jgi:hypothetical protein